MSLGILAWAAVRSGHVTHCRRQHSGRGWENRQNNIFWLCKLSTRSILSTSSWGKASGQTRGAYSLNQVGFQNAIPGLLSVEKEEHTPLRRQRAERLTREALKAHRGVTQGLPACNAVDRSASSRYPNGLGCHSLL